MPRRLTMRLLPRRTSFSGSSCPVMRIPNGITFAARCTSMTRGLLEWTVKWPKKGICICGLLSKTVLSCINSRSSLLTQTKGSSSTYSRWCASPRGLILCDSISRKWDCWMTTSDTSPHWRTPPRLYQWQIKGISPLARLIWPLMCWHLSQWRGRTSTTWPTSQFPSQHVSCCRT